MAKKRNLENFYSEQKKWFMWILQKILQWWLRFMVRIVYIKPFVCLHDDLSHNGKGFPNNTKIVLSFSIFCGTINLKRYFYLKEDTLCTRKIHSLFQLTSQLTNDSICYITVMLLWKKIGTKPTLSIFFETIDLSVYFGKVTVYKHCCSFNTI